MSNKNQKLVSAQVEGQELQSEAPTKVVQMETAVLTVSQMISRANFFHKMSRDLETLYAMHERFNSMFFNMETLQQTEIKTVYLSLKEAGDRYVGQDECFKVTNPETILKIRALVAEELASKITELENKVLTFKI